MGEHWASRGGRRCRSRYFRRRRRTSRRWHRRTAPASSPKSSSTPPTPRRWPTTSRPCGVLTCTACASGTTGSCSPSPGTAPCPSCWSTASDTGEKPMTETLTTSRAEYDALTERLEDLEDIGAALKAGGGQPMALEGGQSTQG